MERAFRREVARVLAGVIGNSRGAASQAARELRISRQAVSLYLKQKATPSGEIVRRICERWNISLNVEGMVVAESTYRKRVSGPVQAPPLQLPLLPAAIDSLENKDLKVKIVKKVEDAIELKVSIDFRR